MKKGKIVAIGGGEIGRRMLQEDGSIKQYPIETMEIDREIVRLSGKKNPKLLFIGTASDDVQTYIDSVKEHFGGRLGCAVQSLSLVNNPPSANKIKESILETDIVYVGGGNTNKLIRLWKEYGLDALLSEALERGTVLSGLSAGANCWFKHYSTDSKAIEQQAQNGTLLEMASGLGFIDGVCVPHTMTEVKRMPYAKEMLMKDYKAETFYAIDDYTALVWENGKTRSIISSIGLDQGAKVRKLDLKDGQIQETIISTDISFKPIEKDHFER